jgi:hypothetical protein
MEKWGIERGGGRTGTKRREDWNLGTRRSGELNEEEGGLEPGEGGN